MFPCLRLYSVYMALMCFVVAMNVIFAYLTSLKNRLRDPIANFIFYVICFCLWSMNIGVLIPSCHCCLQSRGIFGYI